MAFLHVRLASEKSFIGVIVVAVVVVLSKFCRFSVVTAASIGRGSP